jgi:hypothetical protein
MKSWLLLFFSSIVLTLMVACGGSGDSSEEDPSVTKVFGILTINITGLPSGIDASITITDSGSFSQTITETTTITSLTPGSYSISATDVSANNSNYLVSVSTQSVTVSANQTSIVLLEYTIEEQQSILIEEVFPNGLAVASPTDTINDAGNSLHRSRFAPAVMTTTTAYADAVARINALLNGEVAVNDVFTPDLFFNAGVNANCYGPSLLYEDHPDAASPNSGQLPGGDLMMWLETDSSSGHTCSAAQLNARLRGIKNQSFASLMSLASMLFVANSNGDSLPEVGSVLDLTTDMNALGLTGINFTASTIEQPSADQWKYTQNYSYNDGSGTARNISVTLTHNSGASDVEYDGLMAYIVNGDDTIFGGGNCQQSERTLNGSLAYSRESDTLLKMQSRVATLCGTGSSGFITDITATDEGQVDPGNQYDTVGNPDGWSENFNLFGMEMDPNTLKGSYAYVWQAGLGDSHSRIFLMGVNFNETGGTGQTDGEAYAGYGDTIANTDGMIDGLICNWAGPNNSHALQDYTQRQFFTLDETSGLYFTSTGGSDISYAPTNSCEYDGSGTFKYDTDLDNDLSDETASPAITTDLMSAVDTDGDTIATIAEAILNRGFNLPDIPGGFPQP